MFSGGCVFIDHASGYVSIKHQVDINATETVKSKLTFEREDQSQGVVIEGIRTGRLKVQGNSKAVANCESPRYIACEFGKGHIQPNNINTIKKIL